MMRANREAADAAKSAADTARCTLQQSVEIFRIDERAWVEIEPIKPVFFTPRTREIPRAGFKYDVYPRNTGKTTAWDVKMKAQVISSSEQLGNDASMIGSEQDKYLLDKFTEMGTGKPVVIPASPVPKVIAPNVSIPVPYSLHGQEPQLFGGHGMYDYLLGRIDYVDQFNVTHWIKFCFFVVNQRGELRSCQYGNDEDRNPEIPASQKTNCPVTSPP